MSQYSVETTKRFDREFKKLDYYTQKLIKNWVLTNLVNCTDPRQKGKPLKSNRSGQWRYRIGNYRIICSIDDFKLVILALSVGHRKEIYR